MKTYEIVFDYTKVGEEPEKRTVLVMRETEEALAGYDMKYLDNAEQARVKEIFKDNEVINNFDYDKTKKDPSELTKLEKEIKVLNKAWRRFDKSKMSKISK